VILCICLTVYSKLYSINSRLPPTRKNQHLLTLVHWYVATTQGLESNLKLLHAYHKRSGYIVTLYHQTNFLKLIYSPFISFFLLRIFHLVYSFVYLFYVLIVQ